MKKIICTWLFIAAMIPASLNAQTVTVPVPSDAGGNEGNLNTAITNAINAGPGTLSNTVFTLDAGGYYILNGTVTVPATETLTIVGPDPGTTQATALPEIVLSSKVSAWRYTFDCFGDVSLKNVWLLYATTGNTQQSASFEIEDDTVQNTSGKGEVAKFEDVIFDYAPINGSVESRCQQLHVTFTNCYWRNNTDPHYVYYGRAISWPYSSTTWHTDTAVFVNCTFSNMGYGIMQEAPEWMDYLWLNHCTFLNINCHTIESQYWKWLNVSNCIFVNAWMLGDQHQGLVGRGAWPYPNGGTLNIDSLANAKYVTPNADTVQAITAYTDADRHILFTHSSYYIETWLTDWMDHGNSFSDTAGPTYKAHPQPIVSARTAAMFDTAVGGVKVWPHMNWDTTTLYGRATIGDSIYSPDPSANPGFVLPPTNETNIKAFLLGRWSTGANLDWSYNISDDENGVWPMNEDLSYSNSQLMTAAMGGFPLGDLYHWWPAEYTTWKAQEAAENDTLTNWLTNGLSGAAAVKERPGVLDKYALAQNYPNPFNPTTQINYSVPQNGYVTLKVFNVLGQEVATLFSGVQRIGNYHATFDGSRFASGVYFYHLQAGSVSITKKLVLMK